MKKLLLLLLLLPALAIAQKPKKAIKIPTNKEYVIALKTDFGTAHLILFDQTPKHKANFIQLVDRKFYDGLLFHRIIEKFMIQGGDSTSRNAPPNQTLGNGDLGYRIPAEFVPSLFHKKGALAAARDNNPDKTSSASQFYIVQGRVLDDEGLNKQIERIKSTNGRLPTDEQKQVYKTIGGTPFLDGNYTVFGQIIDGLAVVDSIAKQPRGAADRPVKDIRMTMTGELMKKKKITKKYGYPFL